MVISLGSDVYVNAAHISLVSGVQAVDHRPNAWQIRIVLMGNKEHILIGSEEAVKQTHQRIRNALDQLGP